MDSEFRYSSYLILLIRAGEYVGDVVTIWPRSQFFPTYTGATLAGFHIQGTKGGPMSEFSDWLQNNWIDLARLGVQAAILAAVVCYGRRLLATLRASQEQIGALLKLSVADGVSAQASSN